MCVVLPKNKKHTPNQPETHMLAISYTKVQLLKSACAQVQKTEYPMQRGAFISCHKTCFPAGIISLSERFSRHGRVEKLHKMGCDFKVYGRCLFSTTDEHLGQVEEGEEITECIFSHTFTPFNYHVTNHLRDADSIGLNSGHVLLCHVLQFS